MMFSPDSPERMRDAIELSVRDMTIRMGAIAIALFAALATIKFFRYCPGWLNGSGKA